MKPNFVLILADDLGYGDLGCYGSSTRTPHLDRMADQGLRFTDFYAASPVCTPSRAAVMTGSYPKRVGMAARVIFPRDRDGLDPGHFNLAQSLREAGYTTSLIGKWHLGHAPEWLPRKQGFDHYFGLPYSNDMPGNALQTLLPVFHAAPVPILNRVWREPRRSNAWWNPPLIRDDEIIEQPADQASLLDRYTDEAVRFVRSRAQSNHPFFLFVSHNAPHIPLFVPPERRFDHGPEEAYRLVVEHLDESTGRIIDAIDEAGIGENTLVLFVSDNGPWLRMRHHGGSSGPFRAGKRSVYEGGVRVPCLARMPGSIPQKTETRQLATAMDFFPTFAGMAGAKCQEGTDRPIDGRSIAALLKDPDTETSPHESFVYFDHRGHAAGVRKGDFKLVDRRLYRLTDDPGERRSLHRDPDFQSTYRELSEILEKGRREIRNHHLTPK